MKNKFAFTLAEVLITLVIIGVVAALTISAVVNTYVERSTISKVKKGLSTVAQARRLSETQNGSIIGWDFEGVMTGADANKFMSYIKPYLSIVKDCGSDTDCYQSNGVYRLNGDFHLDYNTSNSFYKFVLSDGSVMWLSVYPGKCSSKHNGVEKACAVVYYDINGSKSPNIIGKDIFAYILNINGVYPPLDDCNKNGYGWGCAAYIIKNNNMNYLH